MTILVLSSPTDSHAIALIDACKKRGEEVLLFNPSTFPLLDTITATCTSQGWQSILTVEEQTLNLEDVTGIWYRKPDPPEVHHMLQGRARTFALKEARHALGGLLGASHACWINPLHAIAYAEYKPVQLEIARSCGLLVPQTLISNDPKAVQDFLALHPHLIYKTLSGPRIRPVPQSPNQEAMMIYTSRVSAEDLKAQHENIRCTPCLFQEWIPKQFELRITIVGEKMFPVAINSQQTLHGTLDFRRAYGELVYQRYTLPASIEEQLWVFVRRLGLVYAAIDMVVTPEGQHIFIEANPQGQYLWIERETHVPITDALIDVLTTGKTV